MRNLNYDAFLSFDIWTTFGGKMGGATTRTPNGLGPLDPTKTLVHGVDLSGPPLSGNHVFEIFRGDRPPPPLNN